MHISGPSGTWSAAIGPTYGILTDESELAQGDRIEKMIPENENSYGSPEVVRLRLLADVVTGVLSAVLVFSLEKSIPGAVIAGWIVSMGTDKYINPMIWEAIKDLESDD